MKTASQLAQETHLTTYKINRQIEAILSDLDNIDLSTGEIPDEILKRVEALELRREEVYREIALYHNDNDDLETLLDIKIKKLQARKQKFQKRKESALRLLSKFIPEGLKYEWDDAEINWTHSQYVKEGEFLNKEKLHKDYPELCKKIIDYVVDKMEVKRFSKTYAMLPEGLTIEKKKNIQIK